MGFEPVLSWKYFSAIKLIISLLLNNLSLDITFSTTAHYYQIGTYNSFLFHTVFHMCKTLRATSTPRYVYLLERVDSNHTGLHPV